MTAPFSTSQTRELHEEYCRLTKPPASFAGQRIHRFVVVGPMFKRGNHYSHNCVCDCGKEFVVRVEHLRSGAYKTCGCGRSLKHGHARAGKQTHEYRAWRHILRRCLEPGCVEYGRYGGRGITICNRWRESFSDFLSDMGPKPTPKHSIDRINNNGNYEPGNCRWATPAQQSRNTSKTVLLTFGGKTMCMTDWARSAGLPFGTLRARIAAGKPLSLALSPAKHHSRA